jgi:hypothetical protein
MANESTLRQLDKNIRRSSTPYGDLTVVDRDNRIDVSSETPLSDQTDDATAGVTHQPTESVFRIRANAGTESIETIDSLQYTPGYIAEVGLSLQIPQAPTGSQEVRWGYWDTNDGVYFGWDSDGVFIERLRNGTREGKVYQENFSSPELPNIQAELKRGTISIIELALYNFGQIEFQIFDSLDRNGKIQSNTVHIADVADQTTLSSQDNPIRVEVDNPDTTDFDVFLADRQAAVRGQFTPNRRIKGELQTAVSLSGTTWVPVVSFRRKEAFKTVNTELFDLSVRPQEDLFIQVREDAGSTTDADYSAPTNVNASETAIETDTTPSASISDGYYLFQTQFDGGQGNQSSLGRLESVDLQLKNSRPVTIFARRVSGTGGTIDAFNFNVTENW